MNTFSCGLRRWLTGAFFCSVALGAQAQRPERVATHIDSLRAARRAPIGDVYPVKFTLVGGRRVSGFLTGIEPCYVDKIECYEKHPSQLPTPPLKALSIERIEAMEVEGHHYESLRLHGKLLKMLTENMTPGGGAKTYGYFITKAGMYIPIPLPVGAMVIPVGSHDKYFWYVQPAGGTIQEVPRASKAFAALMAVAFADCPELAARVRQQTPAAGYKNMPTLVQEYKAHFADR